MAISVATVRLRDSASRANALVERYPIESSAVASTAHAIRLSRTVKPLSSEMSVTPRDEQGACPVTQEIQSVANPGKLRGPELGCGRNCDPGGVDDSQKVRTG